MDGFVSLHDEGRGLLWQECCLAGDVDKVLFFNTKELLSNRGYYNLSYLDL